MKLDAILWDYDGTLVNSVPKNIDVTINILSIVTPQLAGEKLPIYLKSESAYNEANHSASNWQELYQRFYGLTQEETLLAGSLWTDHQASNNTPVDLFPGIKGVIESLSMFPHGICSQNSSSNIWKVLIDAGVHKTFKSVIGYSDVEHNSQKPSPDAGIKCLSEMFADISNKTVMFIGDHEADVQFARNLNNALSGNAKVISVAVAYSGAIPDKWYNKPDYIIKCPNDIVEICSVYV